MQAVAPAHNRYDPDMAKRQALGAEKVRTTFKERLDDTETQDPTHTVVQRRGRAVAVLVDIDWYRRAAEALAEPTEF